MILIWFLLLAFVVSALDPGEVAALCAFANGITVRPRDWPAEDWICSTAATKGCSWRGNQCDSRLHLRSLYIGPPSNGALSGTIPTEIGLLSYLRQFRIGNGNSKVGWGGTIPTQVALLPEIANFQLYGLVNISGTIPRFTSPGLQVIDIRSCGISGTIPTWINKMDFATFRVLTLISVNISGTIPPLSSTITALSLESTLLSGSLPTQIALLQNLTQVSLAKNSLTGTIPTQLSLLTKVNLFRIEGNRISGTIPKDLFLHGNRKFVTISLSQNRLSGTIPSHWENLAITSVELSQNQLSGGIPLLNITYEFFVARNRLTSIAPGFWSFTLARKIDFSNNKLTGTLPDEIFRVKVAKDVLLNSNRLEGTLPRNLIQVNHTAGYRFQLQDNLLNGSIDWLDEAGWDELTTKIFVNLQGNRLTDNPFFDYRTGLSRFNQRILVDPQDNINECQDGTHFCNQNCTDGWNPPFSYTCGCTSGFGLLEDGITCVSCVGDFIPLIPTRHEPVFPSLNLSRSHHSPASSESPRKLLPFETCSKAVGGIRVWTREVDSRCSVTEGAKVEKCSFPAAHPELVLAEQSLQVLTNELFKRDHGSEIPFLTALFQHFLDQTINFTLSSTTSTSKKRAATDSAFDITMTPCPSNMTAIEHYLGLIMNDLLPNLPNKYLKFDQSTGNGNCNITVAAQDPTSKGLSIGLVLGIVIPLLILIAAGIVFWYLRMNSLDLSLLPKEVAWPYLLYQENSIGWHHSGTQSAGYYYKDLNPSSKEYSKAIDQFRYHFGTTHLKILSVKIVFNPLLVSNFIGAYVIQKQRAKDAPEIFSSKGWSVDNDNRCSFLVHEYYEQYAKQFSWNQTEIVPIIPGCYGTSISIAERTCANGFAALSSVDAGRFGTGIYFTTHPDYFTPYLVSKTRPALISSWLLPGNVYPVTEHPTGPTSLAGAALKSGYNSHFVSTDKQGFPKPPTGEFFTEVVIPQESQISPAFIFEICPSNVSAKKHDWTRTVSREFDTSSFVSPQDR